VIAEDALHTLVHGYTREAGVRNLEREIASVLRKATRKIGEGARTPIVIEKSQLKDYLGPQRFFSEVAERLDRPGVATGLGWTPAGGDLLFVEATMMPGDSERLILTGMLGDVMSESAQAALSYLKTNADRFGIDPHVFEHRCTCTFPRARFPRTVRPPA
jgi:ATP-dependent Lon protease